MKVLCVLDSLAPGGTERSTIVLAPYLRRLGIDVTIVTLRAAEHDLTEEARAAGTTVCRLESTSFGGQLRELRGMIRTGNFDIVHTALFDADQLGRIAAWGTGVPVVSSLVNTPYEPDVLADPNITKWKHRVVQYIDAVTGRLMVSRFHAVSEGVRLANMRALRIPEDRVSVAERGRDVAALGVRSDDRRGAARESLGVSETAEVVLNLGRLDHQKAQTDLITAAGLLAESHPELVVLIAGKDGSAGPDVRASLRADERASAHVRLLGHRSDVGDLLCAADVLVISSRFEGTAGAALEAMALATPIVSTRLVGLGGVLEDGVNAVLVKPSAPKDLAEGIDGVLGDPSTAAQLAGNGLLLFESRYTLDAAAQQLRRLYDMVVHESA